MHFHHREGIETVAALGIPDVKILVSGEALVARGIRPRNPDGDFDIVTTPGGNLYLEEKLGFKAIQQVIGIDDDGNEHTITARIGTVGNRQVESHERAFSVVRHNANGRGKMLIDELLGLSDQDDETDVYVLNEFGLLLQKERTTRGKDKNDVRRIHQHREWGY